MLREVYIRKYLDEIQSYNIPLPLSAYQEKQNDDLNKFGQRINCTENRNKRQSKKNTTFSG